MKAIVRVNKRSAYAKYNGHTFEVKEVLSRAVALRIDEETVADFLHKEVLIVDFAYNKKLYHDRSEHNEADLESRAIFTNLMTYQIANNLVDL